MNEKKNEILNVKFSEKPNRKSNEKINENPKEKLNQSKKEITFSKQNLNQCINTKHKDRLFRKIFGSEEYRENTLALYNALNNSSYDNPDDLELKTIDDVIYIGMKNDLSFLIADYLNLYEQQSSFNPNMPVRGFMYFGKMYSGYITDNKYNLYGRKQVKLPTPKYIVLYNGEEERPAVEKMKLSDAFINKDNSGEYEWTATVINLNHVDNKELIHKCKPLYDYTVFVKKIQKYKKSMSIEMAVNRAVDECIQEGRMEKFLKSHKGSVIEMCITEFNEDVFVRSIKEEGREEIILDLVKDGVISEDIAAQRLGITLELLHEKLSANE